MRIVTILLLLALAAHAQGPRTILEDGATVDLAGETLAGPDADGDPDGFTGIGLLIEGRKNVTVRGGRLKGFRCAILVRDCENVVLEDIDVSGNFRQRLKSTPEREITTDWLRPHDNDEQQWRKSYGAGICVENSSDVVIRNCVGRKQQNGILLDRCTGCRVYDNDMSFNSGWGIALWRSSRNTISKNRFDWCVRGYSHGVYDRGQDSAGILVFEQCHNNVFAYNSATHGGDGFFLFAGNDTLKKTGRGGCNGNLVAHNDFSHAVANGIEATFSTENVFLENVCDDCNYGIWAGYSYGSAFLGNSCADNRIAGIAIEHGERNVIALNRFARNRRGVWLWWDDDKDLLASRFGKEHACLSRDVDIQANTFENDRIAIHLRDTSQVRMRDNEFKDVGKEIEREGKCEDIRRGDAVPHFPREDHLRLVEIHGESDPFLAEGHLRGMQHILVDEWGPLDPNEHAVFPREVTGWGACAFHVLGPSKAYEVKGLPTGLTIEKGVRTFRVRGERAGLTTFSASVELGGHTFPIRGLLLSAKWRVRHWKWTADPREGAAAWKEMLASEPAAEFESDGVEWTWGGGGPEGVARDRFATRAETTMRLPAGRYEIRTLSDDGVRVFIDGAKVQVDWTWHGPTEHRDVIALSEGEHEIVVEHFEIDGYSVLHFDLRPLPGDPYRGKKYADDPRMEWFRRKMPEYVADARARLEKLLETRLPEIDVFVDDAGGNRNGAHAESRRRGKRHEVVLRAEYLVSRAFDVRATLAHEFLHCLHRDRAGEKAFAATPVWLREGMAVYAAGQAESRLRMLAAYAGSERHERPLDLVADGLEGVVHSWLDYFEDASVFFAVEREFGRVHAVALLRAIATGTDLRRAIRDALSIDENRLRAAGEAYARGKLDFAIHYGRDDILAARESLESGDAQAALERLDGVKGVYDRLAPFYRAQAFYRLGRVEEALEQLEGFLGAPRESAPWIGQARLLELKLLDETGSPDYRDAVRRARLDLEPFPVYEDVLRLIGDRD